MSGSISAPWDDATVAALNAYQRGGGFHGYTCGTHTTVLLLARADGWHCHRCYYQQNWASVDSVAIGAKVIAGEWPNRPLDDLRG